jgi:hypothetical protein
MPAVNACVVDPEVQEQIKIPIPVDILQGGLHRRRFRASFTKTDGLRINGMRVEIRIREDGHGDGSITARIDAVWKVIRLDIDEHLRDAWSIQFGCGNGMLGVLAA